MQLSAGPKVSCLIPVYNAQLYIREALDSIVGQSFRDWEMIVVNDGSTDASLDIINEVASTDERIKVLSQENVGIVAALNNGLKMCSGKYVARMDADDVSFPNRFEDQVLYLDKNPDCVCVGGLATELNSMEHPGSTTTGGPHRKSDFSLFPPKVAVAMHPLIMVRRGALEKIGGYRSEYTHAEDYDLYIRLAGQGSIDNPDIPMLFYRRHEGAISLKNLEEQEHSAALAEADNFFLLTGKMLPSITLETYKDLRVWRRYIGLGYKDAYRLMPRMAWNLIRPLPIESWTRNYFRVRMIIAMNMIRLFKSKLAEN